MKRLSHLTLPLGFDLRLMIEAILKVAIFGLLLFAIYKQAFLQRDIGVVLSAISGYLVPNVFGIFTVVLFLMIVNRGVEALKWHSLLNLYHPTSFLNSLKATLVGSTMGLMTPNRVGDHASRLLYQKKRLERNGINLAVIDSLSQVSVTLLFGIIGLFFTTEFSNAYNGVLLGVSLGSLFMAVPIFLFYQRFTKSVLQIIQLKLGSRVSDLKEIPFKSIIQLFLLSGLRYLVYTSQYVLLLYLFGIDTNLMTIFGAVSIIFLIQTLLPGLGLFDIGIRGNIALLVLGSIVMDPAMVIAASFTLWTINLVLPALAGYYFLSGFQLRTLWSRHP